MRPDLPSRRRPRVLLAVLVVVLLAALPAVGLVPKARFSFGAKIENLAAYAGQSTCSPSAKRGTTAFADLLLRTYPRSSSLGIVRACHVGGTSEHKEGRAFDWGMNYYDATERKQVGDLMRWLLKTDRHGNRWANARRMGIQYMIWDRKIWSSYRASSGWRPYTGSSPHRDHVHFSLSWNGARGKTSFWNKDGFPVGGAVTDPTPTGAVGSGDTTPGTSDHSFPTPNPDSTRGPGRLIPAPSRMRVLPQAEPLTEETVAVRSRARRGTMTKGAMVAGRRYLVEVSGSYRYERRKASRADAECSRAPASSWRRSRSIRPDASYSDHLDLYVNGKDLHAAADNGQECDASSSYRWIYTAPRTGRVPFKIWDPTSYADNRGSLSVHVVDLGRVSETAKWRVPANAPTGASSGVSLRGGQDYLVTVRGRWSDGGSIVADAECTRQVPGQSWQRDRFRRDTDQYDMVLGRLGRDGLVPRRSTVDAKPSSGADCDAAKHRYTFLWTAEDTMPLNVRVDDPGSYRDNTGRLLVKVTPYEGPKEPPAPTKQEETLTVDATTPSETVSGAWPAGTPVTVSVEGTYRMRDGREWVVADAECTNAWYDGRWRDQRVEGYVGGSRLPLGDLMVNGRLVTWSPEDGGRCDGDHEYSVDTTTPADGQLRFTIADDDFADNAGSLEVTISAR